MSLWNIKLEQLNYFTFRVHLLEERNLSKADTISAKIDTRIYRVISYIETLYY